MVLKTTVKDELSRSSVAARPSALLARDVRESPYAHIPIRYHIISSFFHSQREAATAAGERKQRCLRVSLSAAAMKASNMPLVERLDKAHAFASRAARSTSRSSPTRPPLPRSGLPSVVLSTELARVGDLEA